METHQALKLCVDSHFHETAKRLGLSKSTVYKWTEPSSDFSDSGSYNPLDRLEALMDESLRLKTPVGKALSPLYFLAARFGGHFIPPVPSGHRLQDIQKQLCAAMKGVSEAFSVAAGALEDDLITPLERSEMLKSAFAGMHEFSQLIGMIERVEG